MYNPYEYNGQNSPEQEEPLKPLYPEEEIFSAQPEQKEEAQEAASWMNPEESPYGAYAAEEPPVYAAPMYAVPCETKPRKKKQKNKNSLGAKMVALALCCSLLGGAIGAGGLALLGGIDGGAEEAKKVTTLVEGHREQSVINVAEIDTSKLMSPAEVYAANVSSTVGITTSVTTTNFWGYQTTAAASGSGFVISDDGYVLTNFHVIEGADSVTVTMYDNTTYEAELIGYDESNDIAVLKMDAANLTPVILGNSDSLQVGDSVVAIGNPLGELTFSLTSGAVSALDRTVTMSNNISMDLIQTDCAINSGNSGGALFNLYGEVVGITNAKYSGSGSGASIDNIGFAIPINTVRSIVQSLIENGYISKPYIGVTVGDVSQDAQTYGLPQGAAVRSVVEDGPAAKAGLQANDIVTAINGQEISSGNDLVKAVAEVAVGDTLELKVFRQNETLTLTVTVDERIQDAMETQDAGNAQQPQNGQQGNPFEGFDPFSFFGY